MAVDSRARALLDLATAHADGELPLGGQRVCFERGRVVDVRSIDAAPAEAPAGAPPRALWVERLCEALARAVMDREALAPLEPAAPGARHQDGVPLVPLVLDALARGSAVRTASQISTRLNHRLRWLADRNANEARAWAGFEGLPAEPAVSTLLAKHPGATPRLAALVSAGFVELAPAGGPVVSRSLAPGSLPPAPARRSLVPVAPTSADPLAPFAGRPPARRASLRLDPGSAFPDAEPLVATPLRTFAPSGTPFDDPLWGAECELVWLEQVGAPGSERARALHGLADLWQARIGAAGEAARVLGEAVAADPSDAELVRETAERCHSAGDAPLALRYASAAIELATSSKERAAARRVRARLHAALAEIDACVEDLCEAAADDPDDAELHEAVADVLATRGDPAGANAHLRLAAAILGTRDAVRSEALLSWALDLLPSDVPTAYEYASALDAAGRKGASLRALAGAAEHVEDAARRQALRLEVAQRASELGQHEIELELLEAAFDDDPSAEIVLAPLERALERTGTPERRAAVLEDVAASATVAARSRALLHAANALFEVANEREAGFWLAYEAALVDPRAAEPLAFLRAQARTPREATILAHALRAAIAARLDEDAAGAVPLLEELAQVSEERIASLRIAQAAWEQVRAIDPDSERAARALSHLAPHVRETLTHEKRCEQAYEQAQPAAIPFAAFDLARALMGLPEHWPRAIDLYRRALDGGVEVVASTAALELLLGLQRDPEPLARFLEGRLAQKPSRHERLRLLDRLAAAHVARGDARAVAVTCAEMVALAAGHPLATARWRRAAARLGDPELVPPTGPSKRVPPPEDAAAPVRPRAAPRSEGDAAAQARREALGRWVALVPSDTVSGCALVALELARGDAASLSRASERLLAGLPTRARLAAAAGAADRLLALGANDAALAVLVSIGRLLGRPGDGLTAQAIELARSATSAERALPALEWAASSRDVETRVRALGDVVRVHRERGDRLAESRALGRLLADHPDEPEARTRFETLLAAIADPSRLLAWLTSTLDAAATPEARERCLLDLASASLRLEDGKQQAEAHLRRLVAERLDDVEAVRRALGALLSIGEPAWALERCEAIAESVPSELGGRIALWIVASIERALRDRARALDAAIRFSMRFPGQGNLLLALERIALEMGAVDKAVGAYETLIDAAIGAHGRRALRYREGRWLERAGQPRDALGCYLKAFALSPGLGVAYRAAERVARATGDDRALVDLYLQLKDAVRDPTIKADFLQRAAAALLDGLNEPLRGYELLVEANELSETFALDDELRRQALALAGRDAAAGRQACEALRRHWEGRLEGLWDASARVACLRRLAELLAEGFGDVAGALTRIQQARSVASDEALDEALRAELDREHAALVARGAATAAPPEAGGSH